MTAKTSSGKLKWLFAIIIIVAIAISAGFTWTQHSDTHQNQLRLYGNVDIREVQLAFRQAGRIEQMMPEEGDTVTRGMPLATLDDQPYRDALALAEASVRVAEAELTKLRNGLRPQEITQAQEKLKQAQAVALNTERDYKRESNLLPARATSQRNVDAAKTARDQAIAAVASAEAALSLAMEGFRIEEIAKAQANLEAAKATREQAVTALTDTKLIAPSDGTIIARVREPGSMVASQSTIYSLSLDKPIYIRAYVAEPDLGRVAPGTLVRVTTDSSSKTYHGQVGFVSPRAEFTPKTVETTDLRTDLVYRLRIVIDADDSDKGLRQGMPVTIEVEPNSKHPAESQEQ